MSVEPSASLPRPWGLLGAPSSVAAHWPGIEKAPAVLRAAGVVEALRATSVPLRDFGDLPVARWTARRHPGEPNNVDGVAEVLHRVRGRLEEVFDTGHRPLVLGGECTLTIAVVAALVGRVEDVGVVYVDGGQDLMIPRDHPHEPILDGMGVAHLLDLPGSVEEIAAIGPRRPVLASADVVFFGFSEDDEDIHHQVSSARVPAAEVAADPEASASAALRALRTTHIVVHVDVDVLDFLRIPAADVPVYGRGLGMDHLERALRVFARDPRCAALVLTEYNPDHDPSGRASAALIRLLANVLSPASAPPEEEV